MLWVAPVTAALDRLQLGELLFPVAQDVRLHRTQLANLTDREVTLARDRRQLKIISGFQHTLPPWPSVFVPDETSQRDAQ